MEVARLQKILRAPGLASLTDLSDASRVLQEMLAWNQYTTEVFGYSPVSEGALESAIRGITETQTIVRQRDA